MTDEEALQVVDDIAAGLTPTEGLAPLHEYVQRLQTHRDSWKATADQGIAKIRDLERHLSRLRAVAAVARMVVTDPDDEHLALLADKLVALHEGVGT